MAVSCSARRPPDALEDGRTSAASAGGTRCRGKRGRVRSALLLRATRTERVESNLRWSYGHTAFRATCDLWRGPRRVGLRGKSDWPSAPCWRSVTRDRHAGNGRDPCRKLPRDFRVPFSANTPEGCWTLQPFATKKGPLRLFRSAASFDGVERRLLPALLAEVRQCSTLQRWTNLLGALLSRRGRHRKQTHNVSHGSAFVTASTAGGRRCSRAWYARSAGAHDVGGLIRGQRSHRRSRNARRPHRVERWGAPRSIRRSCGRLAIAGRAHPQPEQGQDPLRPSRVPPPLFVRSVGVKIGGEEEERMKANGSAVVHSRRIRRRAGRDGRRGCCRGSRGRSWSCNRRRSCAANRRRPHPRRC